METVLLLGGTGGVGGEIAAALQDSYEVLKTGGHHSVKGGFQLDVSDLPKLQAILAAIDPDIVISSIFVRDYPAQMAFHRELAEWMRGKEKRMIFISSVSVFDGDMTRKFTERDVPRPCSEYAVFKRDCEEMLADALGDHLIIMRLNKVWVDGGAEIRYLKNMVRAGRKIDVYHDYWINITYGAQIRSCVRYILDNHLTGVFHVGTDDLIESREFTERICGKFGIDGAEFHRLRYRTPCIQAAVSERQDIPRSFRMSISEVLDQIRDE